MSLAKAAIEERPEAATPALRRFANLALGDAGGKAHAMFKELGLAAPVPVLNQHLGPEEDLREWPVLKFSSWLQYLLDSGRVAPQLCGCKPEEMSDRLACFWDRFQALHA